MLHTCEWMTHAKPLTAQHSTAYSEFDEQHITSLTLFFLQAKRTLTGNGVDIVTQHASDDIRLTAPGISMNRRRVLTAGPIRSRGAVNHALLSKLNDVLRRYTRTRSYADPSSEHPRCLVWRTSPRFNSKEKLSAGMWDRGSDLSRQDRQLLCSWLKTGMLSRWGSRGGLLRPC